MLKAKHPIPREDEIEFEQRWHTYHVRGQRVPISVTKLGGKAVPPEHQFKPEAVVKANLRNWRSNASSKYHALVTNVSDEDALKNVQKMWDQNRDAGTGMHKCIEELLNNEPVARAAEYAVEMDQFRAALEEMRADGITPVRTELSLFVEDPQGTPVVAGQLDLLVADEDGDYHIVDFKRTANDLGPFATSYGKRFLNGKPLNDHHKYSLQLSLYSVMFELQTGKRIHACRLLQLHPDLDTYKWIDATDLRQEARALLASVGVAFVGDE
tara:strand:+ start:1539 stop:2345 length:807 start_codon:yes stop_codon:yes gene_type:complete